ncbi:CG10748 [Drosophila busckii]|uniref:Malate dehydrogenase n=2 Tax=Drosophila busckii TaxID=30019 RepID=A0A0M5J2I4_DROBS|nr:CG10748 [Drosophila busckii]
MKFSQPILCKQCSLANWENVMFRRGLKVSVVGAAGGIGQPLSLLLKQNPLIKTLSLYDITSTRGVAADLSHICSDCHVCSFEGAGQMKASLVGADVVVVAAGLPRKPGMTRDQLLDANASVAASVAKAISDACPGALLAFITNPVNTIVPIVAEILKSEDAYDPKRLFGVTTLDVVRAKTFLSDSLGVEPQDVNVPVIGGHAGTTILPIISQCNPKFEGSDEEREQLVHRIQEAGTEVVKAKAGKGSATLSMAFAGAHFVNSLLRGINGEELVIECAYVESDVSEADYFSTPLLLGPKGIEENLGLPDLDEIEEAALEKLIPVLKKNIHTGVEYAQAIIADS